MKNKLTVNQVITLKNITYKVIGIDTYKLNNVFGKTKQWISYTLTDSKKNKTWISYGISGDYFTQWASLTEAEFKKKATVSPNLDLSGIAQISFKGNPGFSTPIAEIVWFNVANQNYNYLSIERFLKQHEETIIPLESYYLTGTILKEFRP